MHELRHRLIVDIDARDGGAALVLKRGKRAPLVHHELPGGLRENREQTRDQHERQGFPSHVRLPAAGYARRLVDLQPAIAFPTWSAPVGAKRAAPLIQPSHIR